MLPPQRASVAATLAPSQQTGLVKVHLMDPVLLERGISHSPRHSLGIGFE